jgi:hypothetical protein
MKNEYSKEKLAKYMQQISLLERCADIVVVAVAVVAVVPTLNIVIVVAVGILIIIIGSHFLRGNK